MGGATLYEQTLNKAGKLYITEVADTSVDGDIFFPKYDRSQWLEISRDSFKADENDEYDYSFTVRAYDNMNFDVADTDTYNDRDYEINVLADAACVSPVNNICS